MRIGDLIYLAQHGEFPQPQHPAPRLATFAIETRKVEELEPTGRPLARLKLAPGVVKIVLGIAAVVPAVMTLGFVLMAIVSAVDSARSSAYSGGGFLDEFATVLDSSLTSFYLLVLAVFVLVNILWSLRVIQDVLYPQRGGQNVVLAVAALGFAVVELFVMVGVGAADWVMFTLPFLAHTAVGSLLLSGAVARWFQGEIQTRRVVEGPAA